MATITINAPFYDKCKSFFGTKSKILQNNLNDANTLYNNGKFYYASGEMVSALVSYSCTAVLLNTLIQNISPGEGLAAPVGEAAGKDQGLVAASEGLLDQAAAVAQAAAGQAAALVVAAPSGEVPSATQVIQLLNDQLGSILQVIEALQQKVGSSNSSKDDSEEQDWEKICTKIKPLVFKKGGSDCIFYDDVIGLLKEKKIVDASLIYPLIYPNLYPKTSKGILIYGPPGTGKTYLVKAAVNELQLKDKSVGVLFFAPSPGDLKGKYVGETEKRIEEIFRCASNAACKHQNDCAGNKKYVSIIFMDEMDAIAPDRDKDTTGLAVNSVNTLLQMMDGIKSFPNVTVVAATNYPWNLDGAILRRFDTQLLVNVPSKYELKQLLTMEMNNYLNLEGDKSSFNFCKTGIKTDDSSALSCALECVKKPKEEKNRQYPYSEFQLEYFENLQPNGIIDAIVDKIEKDRFSNSDLNRLIKAAATNAGELAVNQNLFYSASLIKDFAHDKYISSLTNIKPLSIIDGQSVQNVEKTVQISKNVLQEFISNQNPKNIVQLNPPDFVRIPYDGYYYYNTKCLLYKNKDLLITHPLLKDTYIKGHPIKNSSGVDYPISEWPINGENSYMRNIFGYNNKTSAKEVAEAMAGISFTFDKVDMLLAFDLDIKQNTNYSNKQYLYPVYKNILEQMFNPIYKKMIDIHSNLKIDNGKIYEDELKRVFHFTDLDIAELRESVTLFGQAKLESAKNDPAAPINNALLASLEDELHRAQEFNHYIKSLDLESEVNPDILAFKHVASEPPYRVNYGTDQDSYEMYMIAIDENIKRLLKSIDDIKSAVRPDGTYSVENTMYLPTNGVLHVLNNYQSEWLNETNKYFDSIDNHNLDFYNYLLLYKLKSTIIKGRLDLQRRVFDDIVANILDSSINGMEPLTINQDPAANNEYEKLFNTCLSLYQKSIKPAPGPVVQPPPGQPPVQDRNEEEIQFLTERFGMLPLTPENKKIILMLRHKLTIPIPVYVNEEVNGALSLDTVYKHELITQEEDLLQRYFNEPDLGAKEALFQEYYTLVTESKTLTKPQNFTIEPFVDEYLKIINYETKIKIIYEMPKSLKLQTIVKDKDTITLYTDSTVSKDTKIKKYIIQIKDYLKLINNKQIYQQLVEINEQTIQKHFLEIDSDLFEILFKDVPTIKTTITSDQLTEIWKPTTLKLRLIQLFLSESLNMYSILKYKDTISKEVTLFTYLIYVCKSIQNHLVDDNLIIQQLFKGGMLIVQDNYNLNEYDTPTILSQKSVFKIDTNTVTKEEIKAQLALLEPQATLDTSQKNEKIKQYSPPTSAATKQIEKAYTALLVKNLDSIKNTSYGIGKFMAFSFNMVQNITDLPNYVKITALTGSRPVSVAQGTARGGTKKNVNKRNITYKYRGGVLNPNIVSFTDWCYANVTNSTNKNISSVAKKTIFIKTFINNDDITVYKRSTLYNNIISAVRGDGAGTVSSTLPYNDRIQQIFTNKLNDIKQKNQLISICFKNLTNIGTLTREKKIEDDSVLINEFNTFSSLTLLEQQAFNAAQQAKAQVAVDELTRRNPGAVPLPVVPPNLKIYINWKETNVKTWRIVPNGFFEKFGTLIKVLMGFNKKPSLMKLLLNGIAAGTAVFYGGIAGSVYGVVTLIAHLVDSYSNSSKVLSDDEIIENVINKSIFELLTKKRYIECKFFNVETIDVVMVEIINLVENTHSLIKTLARNGFNATDEYAEEIKEAKIIFEGLAVPGENDKITTLEDVLEARGATDVSTYDDNLNVLNYKYDKNQEISGDIKNKLVNLNIPIQCFYYALGVVKTTYNKDSGDLLVQYYENKDLFMENYKKRKP
jgi:SpoVK/Ycf46/Vps4 family AAA+-type ATPase